MIKAKAFAKLNLNLHVFPKKLGDQYSQIKFLNCQINFFDELTFKKQKNEIKVIWDDKNIVSDEDNLILKVAYLLKEISNNPENGVKIKIKKNIPITGGLAGGSADAATTFLALNKLWKINLSLSQLNQLALKLGTDICYLLHGGLCEVSGIGEQVQKINIKLPKFNLIIIYPTSQKPSTGDMYKNLDPKIIGKNLDKLDKLKSAIKSQNKKAIIQNLFNDFESSAKKLFPEINDIASDLLKNGAKKTLLLGSGLGMAGFFLTPSSAKSSFKSLSQKYSKIFLTNTIPS